MQGVTADKTAIDEILSGERRAAGTGARIKRSTGKMVGITAAAAAIAICAGVGLSHLNANDDSSIKSGANTSQTSSVLTPAKQITQSFKLETAPLQADSKLARTTLTLTAVDEQGKEIIKKYANEKSSSYYSEAKELSVGGETAHMLPKVIDSTGYHHEGDYRWKVASISRDKVVFEFVIMLHKAAQEDIPFTVNVFMPRDKEYAAEEAATGVNKDPIIASAKLTYKANTDEYTFVSQYGEKLTASDTGIILHHDVGYDEKNEKETNAINNMLFTFADGTKKTAEQLGQKLTYGGGGKIDKQYSTHLFFSQPIGADKIISITYDGITFNKFEEVNVEQAKFKSEMTEMFASDHSLRVNVKLTAQNDDAKKLLALHANEMASNGKIRIDAAPINLDELPTIGGSTTTTPVINGDTLTTTVTFNRVNSSDTFKDGTKFDIVFTCTEKEGTDCRLIPADRRLTVTVKKNVPERVFKSASGKTLWLTDYQFNCTMDASKLVGNALSEYQITFDDEYNPTKTQISIPSLAGGGARSDKGDPNTHVSFIDKIDSSKVTSVKYAGEVFIAQ